MSRRHTDELTAGQMTIRQAFAAIFFSGVTSFITYFSVKGDNFSHCHPTNQSTFMGLGASLFLSGNGITLSALRLKTAMGAAKERIIIGTTLAAFSSLLAAFSQVFSYEKKDHAEYHGMYDDIGLGKTNYADDDFSYKFFNITVCKEVFEFYKHEDEFSGTLLAFLAISLVLGLIVYSKLGFELSNPNSGPVPLVDEQATTTSRQQKSGNNPLATHLLTTSLTEADDEDDLSP